MKTKPFGKCQPHCGHKLVITFLQSRWILSLTLLVFQDSKLRFHGASADLGLHHCCRRCWSMSVHTGIVLDIARFPIGLMGLLERASFYKVLAGSVERYLGRSCDPVVLLRKP